MGKLTAFEDTEAFVIDLSSSILVLKRALNFENNEKTYYSMSS